MRKFGAAVGGRCQMTCIVHSNPLPQAFYWLDKSATNISLSSSYSILSSGNSSNLTIASVTRTDYGKFICVASNEIGSSRFQLSLLPLGKDRLIIVYKLSTECHQLFIRLVVRNWNAFNFTE